MKCNDCPRKCNAERSKESGTGFCRCGWLPRVVRAAPHFGEEPCISGTRGSGAVFFSGCNLRCCFCQNHEISTSPTGKLLNAEELAEILQRLSDSGVHNINLVTGSHNVRVIAQALEKARLPIPVVWNSSAYESVESLQMLDGLVQIYLPDYKYSRPEPAREYSAAPDYPQIAAKAIGEMFRQRGPWRMNEEGLLQSGVLIRHLILPGQESAAMDAVDFAAEYFPAGGVLFSLMGQYTPGGELKDHPELRSPLSKETNENLIHYLVNSPLTNVYVQDVSASGTAMIPVFDGTGL